MYDRAVVMRYLPQEAFVALTDKAWFDFLSIDGEGRGGSTR